MLQQPPPVQNAYLQGHSQEVHKYLEKSERKNKNILRDAAEITEKLRKIVLKL